jgi:hypothetical protein
MISTGIDKPMNYAHYSKPYKSKNNITKGIYRLMRTHPAKKEHKAKRLDGSIRAYNLKQPPGGTPDQGRTTTYPHTEEDNLNSTLPLPYVDLTHLPDETTPLVSAELLDASQISTTTSDGVLK